MLPVRDQSEISFAPPDMTRLPARLHKSDIPRTYRLIAPVHDWLAVLVATRARRLELAWADIQNGESVLEVAVGTGLSFRRVLRANPAGRNVGIDLSPAMLRQARRRAERIGRSYELQIGDAYALNFPDDTFDVVLNSYMFDLLPEHDFVPVLREFKRVLRPGGRLVQLNMTLGLKPYNRVWDWIYRLHPALLGGCRGVEMAPSFERAGFENVRRAYISQFTYPSEVLAGVKPVRDIG